MVFQKRLAQRMRMCMDSENLTINDLAEKLGVSRSALADYLREKGNPRADTLELIYSGLGYSLENFVEARKEISVSLDDIDLASLLERMKSIHPLLQPLVMRSVQVAEEILLISDVLYENDAAG